MKVPLLILLAQSLAGVYPSAENIQEISFFNEYAYYTGSDAPAGWMNPDFDDDAWPRLASGVFPHSALKEKSWFRHTFTLRSDSVAIQQGLLLTLRGVAEVWLDGRFVGKFGESERDSDGSMQSNRAASLRMLTALSFERDANSSLSTSRHVLAIHYQKTSFKAPAWTGFRPSVTFQAGDLAEMNALQNAFVRKVTTNQFALMSICLAFALLHGLLYVFYARMRANLYYAFITVLAAVNIFFEFQLNLTGDPATLLLSKRLAQTSFIFFTLACLRFMYAVNYAKLPRQFFAFSIISAALAVWTWLRPFAVDQPLFLFMLIVIIEIARSFISMRGRQKQIEGGWIIGAGAMFLVVGALYNILGAFGVLTMHWSFVDFPTPYYGMLGFMIAMSFFLARHFAMTNRRLETKLVEVKKLSEENLQQELERARLEAENARKSQELEEARRIQQSMLPSAVPVLPELEIAVYMRPATEVGGDYYDFKLHDDGALTAAIGDATGHGMQAGAMVSATKGLFTAVADDPEPVRILKRGTKALKSMGLHRMFMALTVAKFRGKEIHIAAAGMPYPLVYRSKTGAVEEIELKGMPLGGFDDFPYQGKKLSLESGDTVLFMSDGLPEMFNHQNQLYGEHRVKDLLSVIGSNSPEEIVNALCLAGEEWADGRAQEDDVTFVVVKVK